MRRFPLIFSLGLLFAGPLCAEEAAVPEAPFDDAVRATLVEQAQNLREQADTLKGDAEARFTRDDAACYQKFLTNDCRATVRETRSKAIIEARRLESEARAIDRRVRQRDAVVHEAERREAQPRRALEQAEQSRKFREAQEQASEERSKRLADKQRQTGGVSEGQPVVAVPHKAPAPAGDAAAARARAAAQQNELDETQRRMAERDKRAAEKAVERAKKEAARVAGD